MSVKKAGLLVWIALVIFLFNGCAKTQSTADKSEIKRETTNDIKIPCLVYQQHGDQITAVKADWDIRNSKLDISKDEVYSLDVKWVNDMYKSQFPVYWDGGENFIIPDYCRPSDKYKQTIRLMPPHISPQNEIFIGDNIEVEKIKKSTGELEKYRIKVKKDGEVITKEVKFNDITYKDNSGKEYPLDPIGDLSFVYYDGKDAYFAYARTPDRHFSIFVVKYNILTGKRTVNEIKLPDVFDPQTIFLQATVENVKEKFYAPTVNGIGLLDLYKNKFIELHDITNKCKNFIKSTVRSEFPQYFEIIGIYNDEVLIVGPPVHTGQTYEGLYCAVKDNEIIGAIYRRDQTLLVMDSNKNIKSEINMQEMNIREFPLAFPGKNGFNWF